MIENECDDFVRQSQYNSLKLTTICYGMFTVTVPPLSCTPHNTTQLFVNCSNSDGRPDSLLTSTKVVISHMSVQCFEVRGVSKHTGVSNRACSLSRLNCVPYLRTGWRNCPACRNVQVNCGKKGYQQFTSPPWSWPSV